MPIEPRERGEPWFLVSIGSFGTSVADALYLQGQFRKEWQPPVLSLRIEAGDENRRGSERTTLDDRRRAGVESIRVRTEDAAESLSGAGQEGGAGQGYVQIDESLRKAFIRAFHAERYIARRDAGDNRPIAAGVAVVLDFSDDFARAALVPVLDALPRISREVLAPLFQDPYRNLETMVIGMAPVAEQGRVAALGAKEALDAIEARVDNFRVPPPCPACESTSLRARPSGGFRCPACKEEYAIDHPRMVGVASPDLRVFIVDDRSDRYVLTERDRVEEVALFAGAVLGSGEPASDPFREIRSPSGERGRREHQGDAIFGTFSVASLSYPGGLVEGYCHLRQVYETLQALDRGISDPAERDAIEPAAQSWLDGQAGEFRKRVKAEIATAAAAGLELRKERLGFIADAPFWKSVGYRTSHLTLSDPNHREIGWLVEPGFTTGPDGLRERTYWQGEREAVDRLLRAKGPTLDRLSVGVQTVQSEKEGAEAPPRPQSSVPTEVLPRTLARDYRWIGRVYGFTETILSETIPNFIAAFDASAPKVAVASRAQLRAKVDEMLRGGRTGLARTRLWLEALERSVDHRLEDARKDLGDILPERERRPGAEKDARTDWKGKFWAAMTPYHAWRQDLELREVLRRSVPYSVVAFLLWLLVVYPAAPALDPRLANPFRAAGVSLLLGLLAVFVPMAWDVYDGTGRLRRGLGEIQDRLGELVTWLEKEFFQKRQDLEDRLWTVRWLQLLRDEVRHERNEVEEIAELLKASIQEVRVDLERMGVRFKRLRDDVFVVDDVREFGPPGVFETWHLPEGPPSAIYERRKTAPDHLADVFLETTHPFDHWREVKPYRTLAPLVELVRETWGHESNPNPFEGGMEKATRDAIAGFLSQFAGATRGPLQVNPVPSLEDVEGPPPPPDAPEEDPQASPRMLPSRRAGGALDWTVFAAAPVTSLEAVLDIAEEVGLHLEPAGQTPLDRVTVVRTLVNVRRKRIEHLLPIADLVDDPPGERGERP